MDKLSRLQWDDCGLSLIIISYCLFHLLTQNETHVIKRRLVVVDKSQDRGTVKRPGLDVEARTASSQCSSSALLCAELLQ